GNDTYIVDDLADVVTEGLNEGTDLIKTALSIYTLGNNVENLLYTGSASFTGTGNALVNTITGGAGN
ncbi:protease, partial [Rhizobium ruizarguesonis]